MTGIVIGIAQTIERGRHSETVTVEWTSHRRQMRGSARATETLPIGMVEVVD